MRHAVRVPDPSRHKARLFLPEELVFKANDPSIAVKSGSGTLAITITGKDQKSLQRGRRSVESTIAIYETIARIP